jgi:tetratricopeptide (TPR) repeat protein
MVTSSLVLDSDRPTEEWDYERSIMLHIERCYQIFESQLAPENDTLTIDDWTRSIAYDLAKVYEYHSNTEIPEKLYRRSLRDVKNKCPQDIEDLRMMNYLGLNLTFQNKEDEALEWHEWARKGMEDLKRSEDDPDVLDTLKHIADLFRKQNDYMKAIEKYTEILTMQEENLEKDHPQTLETRYCLACALKCQGKIDEALQHLIQVRTAREANPKLQRDHPQTLEVSHLIAHVYDVKGDSGEALAAYQKVLERQEEILGKNHYSTIDTIHSIADFHRRMEQYPEALQGFKLALKGLNDIFGAGNNNKFTLSVRKGKADVLDLKGEYTKALKEYKTLHEVYQQKSRKANTVSIWELALANDIGRVLNRMGYYKTAIQWCKETAEEMRKKELSGEVQNHWLTPSVKLCIATIHHNQGQYAQALESYQQVREIYQVTRGEEHSKTLKAVYCIATALKKQGKYNEALAHYNTAEQGQTRAIGETHPSTLETILGKADLYQNIGQHDESLSLYRTVIDGLGGDPLDQPAKDMSAGIEQENRDHPMMLLATYGMGRVWEFKKKYDKAVRYYDHAKKGWENSLGEGHTSALTAELNKGRVLETQKKYRKALSIYDGILHKMTIKDHPLRSEQPFRSQHPLRYETACSKGNVLFKMRQYDEANTSYHEALGGLQWILGIDHPLTLTATHDQAKVLKKLSSVQRWMSWRRGFCASL